MSDAHQGSQEPSQRASVLGRRYRIARSLGKGGMGEVSEAVDQATGAAVALKTLHRDKKEAALERASRLFEQEFHTLSQLRHPRVVEVYDFHKDDWGAFYTMELLGGGDLRALAPLPWRRACALLCDVCSALSLLHSRRLVHRDLTPRNVRCTQDGKAKLIDFGAMSPFGPNREIVGTPACTAPEVLAAQALDARTDLFSLGATAYCALTGRHAYPAPSFNALRNVWRSRPSPPSRYAPDVPKELDELVMSLLQIAPVARPRNAAEVMERLSLIASVKLDEQLLTRQAYLSTPTLVGRHTPLLRIRKQLLRATRGRGGAFLITGSPGMGRSRMLDAGVLEGKLVGAIVLRAYASDASAGEWGGARALLRALHEACPELPPAPSLPEPGAVRAAGESLRPEESRGELQSALCGHVFSAARTRCLVVAVDDFDRLDEPSAAFVALMAASAEGKSLCVMTTATDAAVADASHALSLMDRVCAVLPLDKLDREDTGRLLRSVFGDVPNVELVADRLHAIASGRPRAVMQLAQHLLDREIVRYQAGVWTLPSALDASDVPASLGDALRARLARLSRRALELGRAIALSQRAGVTFAECQALCEDSATAAVLAALDELLAGDILQVDSQCYALSQPGWVPLLLSGLGDAERQPLHARLAGICRDAGEGLLAIQHVFWSGAREQALESMLERSAAERRLAAEDVIRLLESLRSQPQHWRSVLEAMLADCERFARPRGDRSRLRLSIALRAVATSRRSEEHFLALFDELRHDSGLDLYEEFDEALEPSARLKRALSEATARHEAAAPRDRGLSPLEAIRDFGVSCAMAVPLAGRSLDCDYLDRIPPLDAFSPLSPMLWLSAASVRATKHLCAGRIEAAREGYLALLDGFSERAGEPMARRIHHGFTLAIGTIEAGLGIASALERADAIASEPAFAVSASRTRQLYALRMGDFEGAAQHARRVELLQLKDAPPTSYAGSYLPVEMRAYTDVGDLPRLRELMPKLDAMAQEFETWKPYVHYARGHYHLLRRGAESALEEFECGLALTAPGRHLAWALLAGSVLTALSELGRHAEALDRGRRWLEAARRVGLSQQRTLLECPLALAAAACGDFERAVLFADTAIDEMHKLNASGLGLGVAYEARARVAIAMRDAQAFERFARRCAEQYRAGYNAGLTVKYEHLLGDARRAGVEVSRPLVRAGNSIGVRSGAAASRAHTALAGCDSPQDRARAALHCMVQDSESVGGLLYTLQTEGPRQVAAEGKRSPPSDLGELVQAYLSAELAGTNDVTASTASESVTQGELGEVWLGTEGGRFLPLLLSHVTQDGYTVTGLVVLCSPESGRIVVPSELLPVFSQALADAGDVVEALAAN